MRARHFGASSYDDDYDEEEDGPMDMSGFMTSSETQPPVIERPRARNNPPQPSNHPPQGMGNLGPKTVTPPRPVSNMGYAPNIVNKAASNEGSPWNPLWAHDETLGPNLLPVACKSAGLAGLFAGVVYAAGSRQIRGLGGKMMVIGSLAYLHPVLGLKHGVIDSATSEYNIFARGGAVALSHAVPIIIARGILGGRAVIPFMGGK